MGSVDLRNQIVRRLLKYKVLALNIGDPRVDLRHVDLTGYLLFLPRGEACESLVARFCRLLDVFAFKNHVYFALLLSEPLDFACLLFLNCRFRFSCSEVKVTLVPIIRFDFCRLSRKLDCRVFSHRCSWLFTSGVSCEFALFLDHKFKLVRKSPVL